MLDTTLGVETSCFVVIPKKLICFCFEVVTQIGTLLYDPKELWSGKVRADYQLCKYLRQLVACTGYFLLWGILRLTGAIGTG